MTTRDCPSYVAPHRDQLGHDGGKYGGVNCTACAFARALDAGSCGAHRFTGAEIRAASNEAIPDKRSPGLNIEQGDDAVFRLTRGAVNFDSRRKYPTPTAITRVLGGAPAVIQFQRSMLIRLGHGYGDAFGGGHASSLDGIGGLHIDDPLVGRFPVTADELTTILGSLVVGGAPIGRGLAYISFGPDVTQEHRVSVHPANDQFGLYTVDVARRLVIGQPRIARTGGFSARSGSARRFAWTGHTSQSLSILESGALAAKARKLGITYAVRSSYEVAA